MNIAIREIISLTAGVCIAIVGGAAPAFGQTPPPAPAADTSPSHSSAQSEAGEPRATTSPEAPAAEQPGPAGAAAGARQDAPRTGRREAPAKPDNKGPAKPAAVDRLDLQTATVTGDREQPKVMYIVPWKKSDIGDLSGKPMNSLLDEALAPVDRDEFKREVVYYQAVRADASQNGAPAKAPATPR
jgi:hypothetical protein